VDKKTTGFLFYSLYTTAANVYGLFIIFQALYGEENMIYKKGMVWP